MGNNLVLGPSAPPTDGGGKRREIIALVGHLDTVPPDGNETPQLRDDTVYGRGACDMKGGVAVMCDLVEALPETGLPIDPVFIFYDKEEVAFEANGMGVVLRECAFLKDVDFAFVLEPTNLALELGCNGHLNAWITFPGKSAHSARPWQGENAIHRAGPFISTIAGIAPREVAIGDAVYREVISVTLAEGGTARNVIPNRCAMNVNFRYPPDREPDDAERFVRELVPDCATMEIKDGAPPGRVPVGNSILERFRERYAPATNAKQGWTDVARLAIHGIDAINFGPGQSELCHRPDERVPADQLRRCREMLFDFLMGRP